MQAEQQTPSFVEVANVSRIYGLPKASILGKRPTLTALDGVSLEAQQGEILGVVGESGSGKSTLSRLMVALEKPDSGTIRIGGHDLGELSRREEVAFRRDAQIVFQDPLSSLDPRLRVRTALSEPLRSLKVAGSHADRVREILDAVQLPADAASKFPHEFSGGQRQRIAIARALAPHPRVLIADEPVSALDVSVQAQILNLLSDLRDDFGLTVILIAHDLGVVRHMSDHVVVMYRGTVVESGATTDVFDDPRHPYTRRLLEAIPTIGGTLASRDAGTPLPLNDQGCKFAARCQLVHDRCLAEAPSAAPIVGNGQHKVACHLRDQSPLEHINDAGAN